MDRSSSTQSLLKDNHINNTAKQSHKEGGTGGGGLPTTMMTQMTDAEAEKGKNNSSSDNNTIISSNVVSCPAAGGEVRGAATCAINGEQMVSGRLVANEGVIETECSTSATVAARADCEQMRRSRIESSPSRQQQPQRPPAPIERKRASGSGRLLAQPATATAAADRLSSACDLNCGRPANSLQSGSLATVRGEEPGAKALEVEWTAAAGSLFKRAGSLTGASRSLGTRTGLVRSAIKGCQEEEEERKWSSATRGDTENSISKTIKSFVGNFRLSANSTKDNKPPATKIISAAATTLWPRRRKSTGDESSSEVDDSCADELVNLYPEIEKSSGSEWGKNGANIRASYSCQSMLKQQMIEKLNDNDKRRTTANRETSNPDEMAKTGIEMSGIGGGKTEDDKRSSSSSNINTFPAGLIDDSTMTNVAPIAKNKYIIEDKLRKQKQATTQNKTEGGGGGGSSTNQAGLEHRRSTYCSSIEAGGPLDTNYDSSFSSANNYSESINTSAMIRQYSRDSSEKQANDFSNNERRPSKNQTSAPRIKSKKLDPEVGANAGSGRGKGGGSNNGLKKRDNWDKNIEFLLAVIGFAVDLGNVWRFPYICYKNGGGAFLIPYTIMFILGGLPIFYLEMSLGQYFSSGCLTVWRRVCPMAKGIGYAMCMLNFYTGLFYNTIISWAVFFFVESFTDVLPWTNCNNTWNSADCATLEQRKLYSLNSAPQMVIDANSSSANANTSQLHQELQLSSPTKDYFEREVLQVHLSTGIDDLGSIRKPLAIYLAIVFICIYFAIWKGVKSTGKAVWITALLPYFVLIPLLVRGVFLEGAWLGLRYYLYPQWAKITDLKVWVEAAQQIYFSLGPGFGTLMALSSYNKFNHNCRRDALIAATVNYFASFISGLVIFAVLGYMATLGNVSIGDVATEGPGLVFLVYPEGLATMRFSPVWSVLFFTMVITLGIDSTFGGLESVITGLCDDYPRVLRAHRGVFIGFLIILIYLCSLPTTTYGGNYVIFLLESYGSTLSLLFIVLVETIIVCWVYGADRFCKNLEEMYGKRPGSYWRICWKYISPTILLIIFIAACGEEFKKYKTLHNENYTYPAWAPKFGLLMTGSSICCIPIYAIYYIKTKTSGSFLERLRVACRPIEGDQREIYVDALTDKIKGDKDSHLNWQAQEAPSSLI